MHTDQNFLTLFFPSNSQEDSVSSIPSDNTMTQYDTLKYNGQYEDNFKGGLNIYTYADLLRQLDLFLEVSGDCFLLQCAALHS